MIVCCGEAVIDMLPRRTEAGELAYLPMNGGSIFNTAIALGRLGVATGYFSGLSTDFFGESLQQGLKDSHVDLRYTKIQDRPTMLAFVKLENGHARYSFFDENSANRMLTLKDLPKLKSDVKALHFGSIALLNEPAASTHAALMKRESRKRVICLDPNIRPTVIKAKAPYIKRLNKLIPLADILKISDEDVRYMTGHADFAAAAKKWLKAGAKIVVVTKGGEGVEAYTKSGSLQRPAVPVQVVDTVGAGDTFTAGLLCSLEKAGLLSKPALAGIEPSALTACIDFAARAAAITCSRAGANPPWAHELA
jgi:fructokinase